MTQTSTNARRAARAPAAGRGDRAPDTEPERQVEALALAVVVGLSAVVVVPGVLAPSMLPKLTVVLLGVIALIALGAGRAIVERRVMLPARTALWSAGVFAAALVLVTVTSSNPSLSVLGVFERWTGLVPYLAYLMLFLVLASLGRAGLRPVAVALLVALGVVVAYGMLQVAGLDPVDWQDNGLPSGASVFGNVNFASGWTGAVLPLCLWGLLSTGDRRARLALGALFAGGLAVLWETGSAQGPVAAGAGIGLLLAVQARETPGEARLAVLARRWGPRVISAAAAVVLAVAGAVVALRPDVGARQRVHFWDAALAIFADHPLVGSGLDTYGDLFTAYRSAEGAVLYGSERSDAPHSVPLGMLSNGGVLLALAYLGFVVLTGAVLVGGLRRLRGEDRVLLAAFGAVWVGYQVQSLVSFDVPPVALLHYLSAGAIVVLVGGSARVVDLPGRRKRIRRARQRRGAGWSGGDIAGVGAVAVVALVLMVVATRPFRADLTIGSAAPLLEEGRGLEALERFEAGVALAPYEPQYREKHARLLLAAGRQVDALAAFTEAARRDPGSVQYALAAAELAAHLGRADDTDRWYGEALRRDPHNPEVLTQVARHELESGEPEAARRLAGRAVALRAGVEPLLVLAEAEAALGDREEAAAAYRQVLELEPGNAAAEEGVEGLEGEA